MEKENKTINILLIVIMILVVVGCIVAYLYFTHAWEKKDKNQDPIFTMENYPKIDGSTATLPLAQAYKSAFTGTDIENVDVTHSKTHNAYVNLINKKSDLILVTYPSEEEQQLAKDAGVELEIIPVVKEAFVFFVNKENSVDNLTLNQIQDIYSGKVTNWKKVGGTDAQILAYQRPQNSGSQSGMLSLVMQGIKMKEPENTNLMIGSMSGLIDGIASYSNSKNSIGYSVYLYAKEQYVKDNVKFLAINGLKPTDETIANRSYPLTKVVYAVYRKDEAQNSNVRKLVNWLKTEEGKKAVSAGGYVPLAK